MNKSDKIYVAGHAGMVGSAIMRKLQSEGFHNILIRTSDRLDLRHQDSVNQFFEEERPSYVFLAAARVGGILVNNEQRAEFIYDNLMIQSNIIHNAYLHKITKLLFLGSSCIYPRESAIPIHEEQLLTGSLEPTNQPYAIAKIAGIEMCNAYRAQYGCHFISVMPCNLYGPNDNFDLHSAHVLPALMKKIHQAKADNRPRVSLWGSGKPRREFLHVDDLADACLFLMNGWDQSGHINVGSGEDISIAELANLLKEDHRLQRWLYL